jgi:6-phosphogluconolactonase
MGTRAAAGGPAYVAVDGSERWLFAASYGSGELHQFSLADDGTPELVRSLRVGKWAHAVVLAPDNRSVHVPCKGDDLIIGFDFDAETGELTARAPWKCPTRSGPRHMLFARGGTRAYVVGENDCTLTSFARHADRFEVEATLPTLPRAPVDGDSGADLHLSPDERFLYVSNRGHDSLAVFALGDGPPELVEVVPSQAAIPRNFCVAGDRVWVAGQEGRNVARFSRESASGRLTHQADFAVDQRVFWVGHAGGPGAR